MYTKGLFGETDHVSKYINIIILSQTLPWTSLPCFRSPTGASTIKDVLCKFLILYFILSLCLWPSEPDHWKPLIPKNLDAWAQRMVKTYKYNNFHWFGSEEIWIRLFNSWMIPNMKKNQPKSGPGKWIQLRTNRWFLFFFSGLYDVFLWFSRFWLKIKGFLEKTVFSRTYPVFNPYKTRIFWFS